MVVYKILCKWPRKGTAGVRGVVPDALSVGRVLLVIGAAWAVISGAWKIAVVVLVVAGVTDSLDGALARRWQVVSRRGMMLDATADRIYMVVILWALWWVSAVPGWFVAAMVTRDVVVGGAATWRQVTRRQARRISWSGKAATAAAMVVLPVIVAEQVWDVIPDHWVAGVLVIVAAGYAASGLGYVLPQNVFDGATERV